MKISLILAVNLKGVIGSQNSLIWHLPNDLKRFKNLTMGKPMIMGRKTFESIGKPLPGRVSIVIRRDPNYFAEGITLAHSLSEAIHKAKEISTEEIFVVGGGEIYRQALPLADCIYLTRVYNELEGDVFFELENESNWQMVDREFHSKDAKHAYDYEFIRLKRKN